MNHLRTKRGGELPNGLILERPAKQLASLATNEAYLQLENVVINQWKRQDAFADLRRYGIGPLNRVLFYGPPGNGKTVSAQLIAFRLECPLYRVACESLKSKYFGEMTANVGQLMDWLETQGEAVVLFDEVETILPARQEGEQSGGQQESASAMTCFWQRLDRWETPQLFLLATNLPDNLDRALWSRIELKIEFGPPTTEQALNVLAYWRETLHEYGEETWGPAIETRITRGLELNFPTSFRELWQAIQHAVRSHVVG